MAKLLIEVSTRTTIYFVLRGYKNDFSIIRIFIPSAGGASGTTTNRLIERGGLLTSEQNPEVCDATKAQ